MSTRYEVFSAFKLPNGDIALAGHYSGDPLAEGHRIYATTPNGKIVLEIVSVGVVDPILVEKTRRQGIVVRFASGEASDPSSGLEGVTFETE